MIQLQLNLDQHIKIHIISQLENIIKHLLMILQYLLVKAIMNILHFS